eukprot:3190672-Alexandrium_andersonii.AAC.1
MELARLSYADAYDRVLQHRLALQGAPGPVDIRAPGCEALLMAWWARKGILPEWRDVLPMMPEDDHALLFRLGGFVAKQPHDAVRKRVSDRL